MEDGGWKIQRGANSRVAERGGDGDVVHQRVEPDVGDEVRVERERDAPVQPRRRAADAEVFEGVVLEEAEDFVAAVVGLDEAGIRLDVINEPLLVRAELEIPVLLHELDDLAVLRREIAVGQAILLGEECLLLRGVKTRMRGLVEMAGGMEFGENGLHRGLVPGAGVRMKSSLVSSSFLANACQMAASSSQ